MRQPEQEKQEEIEDFYTVAEFAPRVKMSEQMLYAACREKKIPHVRIGTRIRIPASAFKRWVEEQTASIKASE